MSTAIAIQQINGGNPIAPMLTMILEKGGGAQETAAALEKIADLYIKMEASNARKAFSAAKAQLQSELPVIAAKSFIPDNNGQVRSTFAKYEEIMAQIQPHLNNHGFSIGFTMRVDSKDGKDRICAIMKLEHSQGHSELHEFSVRTSGPPKSSEAQADGSTLSYAKRGALCMGLNIVVDHDNDGRAEGGLISKIESDALMRRATDAYAGGPLDVVLRIAGAESFDTIRSERVPVLENFLAEKERANAAKAGKVTTTIKPSDTSPWHVFLTELRDIGQDIPEAKFIAGVSKWVLALGMKTREDSVPNARRAELAAMVSNRTGDFA